MHRCGQRSLCIVSADKTSNANETSNTDDAFSTCWTPSTHACLPQIAPLTPSLSNPISNPYVIGRRQRDTHKVVSAPAFVRANVPGCRNWGNRSDHDGGPFFCPDDVTSRLVWFRVPGAPSLQLLFRLSFQPFTGRRRAVPPCLRTVSSPVTSGRPTQCSGCWPLRLLAVPALRAWSTGVGRCNFRRVIS